MHPEEISSGELNVNRFALVRLRFIEMNLTRDFRSSQCRRHVVTSPNRLALATFVVYTNERANERSTAYCWSEESSGKYWVEFCSTAALVSLVSVEGQNPSQLFATVETSEAIEYVKSSMFMLVSCKLVKTC